jgi:signal transduction histidine kinase
MDRSSWTGMVTTQTLAVPTVPWMRTRSTRRRPGTLQPAHDPQPVITASFRILLALLPFVSLLVSDSGSWAAMWTLPLVLPEFVIRGRLLPDRHVALLGYWWSAVPGVAAAFTGGSHSPLLACLPVGFFLAGLGAGRRGVLQAGGVSAGLLLAFGSTFSRTQLGQPMGEYLASCAQWVLFGAVIGLIAARLGRDDTGPDDKSAEQHAEARALLEQLRSVTSRFPGSLDMSTTCELMLESCLRSSGVSIGAVLVHSGDGYHVPLALRGLHRLPWRSPAAESGPLREAWRTRQPVMDVRQNDPHEGKDAGPGHERSGSALLVVPVLSSHSVLGLVVLQSPRSEYFSDAVLSEVLTTVARQALALETAQTFERVRSAVTVEERSRLARDMHDGVAQDLAYIGFELDFTRARAAQLDPALARSLTEIRSETTRIISDVRASITDLRSSRSLERGLGAALTSHVRNAGASGPLAVHITLDESPFRLPAETEVELLRIAQEFTTLARYRSGARNLWVTLTVEPPAAQLRLEHDGQTLEGSRSLQIAADRLTTCGGELHITPGPTTGLLAEATIEGGFNANSRSPGR